MFTLRYRKSRDNLSSSDVKLSSRILSVYISTACLQHYNQLKPLKQVPEMRLFGLQISLQTFFKYCFYSVLEEVTTNWQPRGDSDVIPPKLDLSIIQI